MVEMITEIASRPLGIAQSLKQRAPLNDGRGHPRIIPEYERGNTASVDVVFDQGRVTLGVDREARTVELLLSDEFRRTITVTLSPHEAKLLGRRLTQAWEAVA